ncbi:MAG: hypothetical protein IKQ91_05075 [Oscillospiraceae bacterium]|nr:hypothetical protein [Oscillospiraceae bacterium]
MKHADKKKLAAMFGVGMLSVSGLVGCAYGPDPSEELKAEFTLNLDEAAETETAAQQLSSSGAAER